MVEGKKDVEDVGVDRWKVEKVGARASLEGRMEVKKKQEMTKRDGCYMDLGQFFTALKLNKILVHAEAGGLQF